MRNYGIVTLPVVAAILLCGLLTTHASAKAVVGRRSALPRDMSDLRLLRPEMLDDDNNILTSGSALSQLLRNVHQKGTSGEGSNQEEMRLMAMLQELRTRLGPPGGDLENSVEHRRTWDKRLEMLANDGSSMADNGVLEARRRMGPEFNPTGW